MGDINDLTRKFHGTVLKIQIISTPCYFCTPPEGNYELAQKLTIRSDGRVWLSKTYYEEPCILSVPSGNATQQFTISPYSVTHIFDAIKAYFETERIFILATDVGDWELAITNTDGGEFKFQGSLCDDLMVNEQGLSTLIRSELEMPDLLVFDGNNHSEERMEKYIYCGVKVKGVKTVYSYISDMGELNVGSYVAVPFGKYNAERIGTVESCGEYAEDKTPFPVENTKHILRLSNAEEYESIGEPSPFHGGADEDIEEVNYYIDEEDWDEVLWWAEENHDTDNKLVLQKVIECYTLCVKQNMPEAALNLGTFYYNGRGVEQDFNRAFELYKIAADAGELRAICNIGYCYYYGRDREIDYAEAYKYFSLGALLYDDANCIYKLGDMYLNGYCVPKNEKYAYIMFERALTHAKENPQDADCLADTQFRVGKCLLKGIGTSDNIERAHELLSLALIGFYKRRKTDSFVQELIKSTQELIAEAQKRLGQGV